MGHGGPELRRCRQESGQQGAGAASLEVGVRQTDAAMMSRSLKKLAKLAWNHQPKELREYLLLPVNQDASFKTQLRSSSHFAQEEEETPESSLHVLTEKRPGEDTARRQLSTRQEERNEP